MNKHLSELMLGASCALVFSLANAEFFPNVDGQGPDIPGGAFSFADKVTSFAPGIVFDPGEGANVPFIEYLGSQNTLGIPDTTLNTGLSCFQFPSQANCRFASLGVGGVLTVEFVDNRLTGSGDSADDLWVYEIGPDIENTDVEISKNGSTWFAVGSLDGATDGLDIDQYGFGPNDFFRFVRLTDVAGLDNQDGDTVGADIDAIAAISAAGVPVGPALLIIQLLLLQ